MFYSAAFAFIEVKKTTNAWDFGEKSLLGVAVLDKSVWF